MSKALERYRWIEDVARDEGSYLDETQPLEWIDLDEILDIAQEDVMTFDDYHLKRTLIVRSSEDDSLFGLEVIDSWGKHRSGEQYVCKIFDVEPDLAPRWKEKR